jgi:hypothetical protein
MMVMRRTRTSAKCATTEGLWWVAIPARQYFTLTASAKAAAPSFGERRGSVPSANVGELTAAPSETFQIIAGYLLVSPIPEHQFGPPRQPAPYTLAPADKVAALLESLNSPEPLNDADAQHRDLILSILTRSMKNRFLRSFKMEVASMKWSPGIMPIQIAFEYENLYRRAALPSEVSEASAALDKARSKTRVLLH